MSHRVIDLNSAFKTNQVDTQWTIEQWHLVKGEGRIQSNSFWVQHSHNYLRFYCQSDNTKKLMCLLQDTEQARKASIKAYILVENDEKHLLKGNGVESTTYQINGTNCCAQIFNVDDKLLNNNKHNLVFYLEITYVTLVHEPNVNVNQYSIIEKIYKAISVDYDKMNKNEAESFHQDDITFLIGETKIRAHSVILAAASPYFAAIFRHENFKENKERTVTLTDDNDVTPQNFQIFLDLIYGRKSIETIQKELVSQVCILADKYGVTELLELCGFILGRSLADKNVIEILLFADKYNCKNLKKKALVYTKNNLNDIKKTEKFDDLCNNKSLLFEVL